MFLGDLWFQTVEHLRRKLKMVEFVLKNNYFELNGKVKKQLWGTAIGTKFAPTYASIFMDKLENDFLKSQELTPLLRYRYIDNVFLIWTHGEEKLASFLNDLNNCHPNIEFNSLSLVKNTFQF